MKKSPLILMGSARPDGKTRMACDILREHYDWPMVQLLDLQIAPYDYQHRHLDDDFLPLIQKMITASDHWILATPVYWYSMSGRMKIFLDRITDLLDLYPEWTERIKGKTLSVLISCSDQEPSEGYMVPFVESARYLGMHFGRKVHTTALADGVPPQIRQDILEFGKWVESKGP